MNVGFHKNMTLHLEGYTMFFQSENRVGHAHCGLITYNHETFLSKEIAIENVHTSWDYLCVQIQKKILCNVYRLPSYILENINLFTTKSCNFIVQSSAEIHLSLYVEILILIYF